MSDLVERARRLADVAGTRDDIPAGGDPSPNGRRLPFGQAGELLAVGSVEILERSSRRLLAEVDDGERRQVRHVAGRWACSCPSFAQRRGCAHLDAVRLVVAAPGLRRFEPDGGDRRRSGQLW